MENRRSAFSLIEAMIVVVIVSIMTTIVVVGMSSMRTLAEYRAATDHVFSTILDARANAISQKSCDRDGNVESFAWVVQILRIGDNTIYSLLCDKGTEGNQDLVYPDTVLPGGSVPTEDIFSKEFGPHIGFGKGGGFYYGTGVSIDQEINEGVQIVFFTNPFQAQLFQRNPGIGDPWVRISDTIRLVLVHQLSRGDNPERRTLCFFDKQGYPVFVKPDATCTPY